MKRFIGYSSLGLMLLVLVFGCTFGMTLEQRIQQLEADLNLMDRADIYINFHPTDTADYAAIRDSDFFAIPFPLSTPGVPATYYTITIVDATDPEAVLATIDSTAMGINTPFNAVFEMGYDGFDSRIVTIQVDWEGGPGLEFVVQ